MKKQNEDYPINSLNLAITDYDGEIEFAVPKLAEDAMKQERLLINNPVKIEYNNAVNIYEAIL